MVHPAGSQCAMNAILVCLHICQVSLNVSLASRGPISLERVSQTVLLVKSVSLLQARAFLSAATALLARIAMLAAHWPVCRANPAVISRRQVVSIVLRVAWVLILPRVHLTAVILAIQVASRTPSPSPLASPVSQALSPLWPDLQVALRASPVSINQTRLQ